MRRSERVGGGNGRRARSVLVDRLEPRSMMSAAPGVGSFAFASASPALRTAVVVGPRLVPAVTSFTLINADTDQPVAGFTTLAAGATLDLSKLP
ncbi:MAG TPA: hypothetical protein VF796_00220, partial [Humisphaera sp.]